jgi:hypothetical protein
MKWKFNLKVVNELFNLLASHTIFVPNFKSLLKKFSPLVQLVNYCQSIRANGGLTSQNS